MALLKCHSLFQVYVLQSNTLVSCQRSKISFERICNLSYIVTINYSFLVLHRTNFSQLNKSSTHNQDSAMELAQSASLSIRRRKHSCRHSSGPILIPPHHPLFLLIPLFHLLILNHDTEGNMISTTPTPTPTPQLNPGKLCQSLGLCQFCQNDSLLPQPFTKEV